MTTVDITCDLMEEDETGYVWTFLHEARDPSLITVGTTVVAGDEDTQALAEVVDIVAKPAGKIVHLRILPDMIEDKTLLTRRPATSAS